jgi:hypothetical protein
MAAAVPSIEKATQGVKVSAVLEFLKHSPTKLLIDGKWVPSKSGKTFETINPANEEVLALVAEGDKADVDEAVKAARKAFEEGKWRSITPHQRTRYLLKLADLVDKYADELAELESLDNGKPVSQARAIDVAGTAGAFRYFAGWPTKIYGETNPSDPSLFNYPARAGGRVWADHPVEFSTADGGDQDRAGAGVRQHDDLEACRANIAHRIAAGRTDPGSRNS